MAAFALTEQALGEPTWTPPIQLAPGENTGYAVDPALAMNDAGDAVLGWQWESGNISLTKVASRRRGAHDWSAPATLAEGGSAPSLAIDAAGDALAGFRKGSSFLGSAFQAAYRRGLDGAWQDPVTISPAPQTLWGNVALNAAGDAAAAFTRWSGNGYVIQAAVRPAASGNWQQVVDLSDPAGNSPRGAAVALDAAGDALALWVRAGSVADSPVVVSAFRPAGGSWSAPVDLGGPYADVGEMSIAFDAAGNAVAAWRVVGADYVVSRSRSFGGNWSALTRISSPNAMVVGDLELTVDDSGDALALWREQTPGGRTTVMTASRPAATGSWHRYVRLSSPDADASAATLAGSRSGNAVAVWSEGFGDATVHAALRAAASGSWVQPAQLGSGVGGAYLAAALDGHGGAVAAWQREVGAGHDVIESSDLETGGPVLAQLVLPERTAAGVPATFRVTPAPWGAALVGEPKWDFGDGSSGAGSQVVHTYRRTGTYPVAVAQSDASGHSSQSTATVVVGRATLTSRRRPRISGVPRPGSMLSCSPGSWTGSQPIRFRYAWLRSGTRVAVGARYRIRPSDIGVLLSCRVTATNGALTRAATSRPVRVR